MADWVVWITASIAEPHSHNLYLLIKKENFILDVGTYNINPPHCISEAFGWKIEPHFPPVQVHWKWQNNDSKLKTFSILMLYLQLFRPSFIHTLNHPHSHHRPTMWAPHDLQCWSTADVSKLTNKESNPQSLFMPSKIYILKSAAHENEHTVCYIRASFI